MELQLRISGVHYNELQKHLFPGDGKEAVAVALCGRHKDENLEVLLVHKITLITYEDCKCREDDLLVWSTKKIEPFFEQISKSDLAILKIHSHPNGYSAFSRTDDKSDREFFDSAFGWSISSRPHASAVMLPDGEIFGRFFYEDLMPKNIDKIVVVGDDLSHFVKRKNLQKEEFAKRTIQAFGEGTYNKLKNLRIGVVGCSGTGSPVIEQLVRLGVGEIVLIDPDIVEEKNLNRILNTTMYDVKEKKSKVDVLKKSIEEIGLNTKVLTYHTNLYDNISAAKSLISCDFVFGCMDSVDGRYLLNQLCTFYVIPYIDLGVKLDADGNGGIEKICGTVNYIQPGKSSLLSRGLYNMDDLRAASQLRKNPEEFEKLLENKYIKNVNVNSPAVISVNMQIASHAVNEFLNRIHPYKSDLPAEYASSTIDITNSYIVNSSEDIFNGDKYLMLKVGRGDILPFIEMSELS